MFEPPDFESIAENYSGRIAEGTDPPTITLDPRRLFVHSLKEPDDNL